METLNPAALISETRLRAGLTQTQLATRAGTSQPAVARYEAGVAFPSTATLIRLLKAGGFELEVRLKTSHASTLDTDRARKLRANREKIMKLAQSAGISNIRIFGSVARGEDTRDSDIDLLVNYQPGMDGAIPLIRFKADVEKLLGERVDVSPESVLKKSILESALLEAIPL